MIKFAFFGTPEIASETLEMLKRGGYIPSLIITSVDKPQGRKMLISPSPVKIWAQNNALPYDQPSEIDNDFIHKLKNDNFDLFIVVAYGKILPKELLTVPKLGSINVHYSLLPKYRGASPVESAILNNDTKTGVTIQQMEYKMDSGDIIAFRETEIGQEERASELKKRLTQIGSNLLIETLNNLEKGKISFTKQDGSQATFCKKIKKEDGLINLNDDALKNYNKFRAYNNWPRVFFFKDGKRIIVTQARLADGNFIIEKIIPENGKETVYLQGFI